MYKPCRETTVLEVNEYKINRPLKFVLPLNMHLKISSSIHTEILDMHTLWENPKWAVEHANFP
jgi:hypothetical protein